MRTIGIATASLGAVSGWLLYVASTIQGRTALACIGGLAFSTLAVRAMKWARRD